MSYIIFILKTAIFDFTRHKMRTFLTSLGILIGVSSVVLLMAFGLGLKAYIKNQFESLGSNLLYVLPGQFGGGSFSRPGGGLLGGAEFDEKDISSLRKVRAELVIPVFMKTVSVTSLQKKESADLIGTTADIFPARNLEVDYGRSFDKADVDKRQKIVVIGPKIAAKIFSDPAIAVNKSIKIEGQSYRVIGVLKSKGGGGFGGPDLDSFIYMPYKTAYQFNPKKTFFSIYLKAESEEDINTIKARAEQVLLKRYEEDDFSIVEQTEILNTVSSIFSVLNSILVAIGAISLIVGGVGIMNIMYVTVTERIKEIGVRRAVGATRRDILLQFLTEATALSLFGGLMGLALSFLITLAIRKFFPAYIDANSVIVAITVSSLVGIVFGVLPAKKAADLSPIEAIRYE